MHREKRDKEREERQRQRNSGNGGVQVIGLLGDRDRSIQVSNIVLGIGGSEEQSTILMGEVESSS